MFAINPRLFQMKYQWAPANNPLLKLITGKLNLEEWNIPT